MNIITLNECDQINNMTTKYIYINNCSNQYTFFTIMFDTKSYI